MSAPSRPIPGPPPLPLLGWRGHIARFFQDPVRYLRMLHERYGLVSAIAGDAPVAVFAFGPENNRAVLSAPEQFFNPSGISLRPPPPGSVLETLSSGLVFMNGAQHREQRPLLQPAFHKKTIERCRDAIVAVADRLLSTWQVGQRIDLKREMVTLSQRATSEALLGLGRGAATDALHSLVERWIAALVSKPVLLLPFDLPGTPYRRMLRLSERFERRLRALIAERRNGACDGEDVLSMILRVQREAPDRMSDRDVLGHTAILLTAGHETTYNALTWIFFLLSQHPAALGSLIDEVEGRLRGAPPTAEALREMPVLDGVIKESLRLFTPSVFNVRFAQRPFEVGGYEFPGGIPVAISPYVTHRLPELYEEPLRFRPERWLSRKTSPYEYIPFSAGSRMCIGMPFALLEIQIVVTSVLQRFRLEVPDGAKIDRAYEPSLAAKGGLPVVVRARSHAGAPGQIRGNVRELIALS